MKRRVRAVTNISRSFDAFGTKDTLRRAARAGDPDRGWRVELPHPGWGGAGTALALLVAALALLAAVTGFCTGCEAYKLGCRLTGRPFVSCPLPPRPAEHAP